MKTNLVVSRLSLLISAITMAACGGGGGGGTTAAAPVAGGAVEGVAAAGLLSSAVVKAYCGFDETKTPLGTATTGSGANIGKFKVSWTGTCSSPVKLVVTPGAGTQMLDEVKGLVPVTDAGFKIRAMIDTAPATTAESVTKNITPFTDMAVAVVTNAIADNTKITAAAVQTAEKAIIETILAGGSGATPAKKLEAEAIYKAAPVPMASIASSDTTSYQRDLTLALASVSTLAQTNAACTALVGDDKRTQCAINTLSTQAVAAIPAISTATATPTYTEAANTGALTTPAELLQAAATTFTAEVAKVATNQASTLLSTDSVGCATCVQPTVLQTTVTTSTLTQTFNDSVATAPTTTTVTQVTPPTTVLTGISAARDLFVGLNNDFKVLLNRDNSSGFLDTKLAAMNNDWNTNGISNATSVVNVLTALDRATAMAATAASANWAVSGTLAGNAVYPTADSNVFLLTDAAGAPQTYVRFFDAGAPSYMTCMVQVADKAAGKAGCYYPTGAANSAVVGSTFTGYDHGVEVASTGSGSFGWTDYTASRTYTTTMYANQASAPKMGGNARFVPASTAPTKSALQTGSATGIARDSSGNLTAGSFSGNIQPIASGQDYSTLAVSMATDSTSTASLKKYNLSGSATNVKTGATTFTMSLKTGSQIAVATGTSEHLDTVNISAQFKTAAFQYDGTLVMNTFTASKNGEYSPAYTQFSGKMSTLSGSTATEFLNGTLTVQMTNLADFDPAVAISSTNFIKENDTFSGTLIATVNNAPAAYVLSYSIDGSTYGRQSTSLTYTNPASQSLTVLAVDTGSPSTSTVSITSGNVVVSLTGGVGDVKVSGTKVGDVTKSGIFFTDSTYILM